MKSFYTRMALGAASAALMLCSIGCSSGNSSAHSGGSMPQAQTGTVNLIVSDAPTEDWATIGVKVLSIALTPQGGRQRRHRVYGAESRANDQLTATRSAE
jgi:hypothetical protein